MNLPSPLYLFRDPVTHYIVALYAALILWEALFPARKLIDVKWWKLKGIAAFLFYFFLSSYLPFFINPFLEPYRLLDLSRLAAWQGAIIGVLLYEGGIYVWRRALHRSNFLFRSFHQMHHSAERLDTYGAFFFSLLDMVGWTVLSSLCFSLVVGLSPQAIVITLLVTAFFSIFQHANIHTPQWLGYIIQRPESHTVHHATGIHAGNYSDLPLFDILFGTFVNPKAYEHNTGFYNGASGRLKDMLLFRDVSQTGPFLLARTSTPHPTAETWYQIICKSSVMKQAFLVTAAVLLGAVASGQDTSVALTRGTTLSYLVFLANGQTPITATLEVAQPDSVSMTWTMNGGNGRFRMGKASLLSGRSTYWSEPINGEDVLLPANEMVLRISAAVWDELNRTGSSSFDGQAWKVKDAAAALPVASEKMGCLLIESEGATRMWILKNKNHPIILKTEGNRLGPNVELYDLAQSKTTN